jgi:hypothetical protein
MKYYAIILFILFVLCGIVYLEYATWSECLADNSWFYCLRILS